MRIPRQVEGPAVTEHQIRSVTVQISQHPEGGLLIRAQQAPGWSQLVRTQDQLARAVHAAFTESQCASYAAWRGQAYDNDTDGVLAPVRRKRGPGRRDVHDVESWMKMEDGRWRSPSGRAYGAETQAAMRVQDKRRRMGLPI